MKIFITGSTGTIGSKFFGVNKLFFDLLDDKTFPTFSKREAATIIHLAGVVGNSAVTKNLVKSRAINVDGTIKFAEHILNKSNFRFMFVSSSHVYRNSSDKHKEDEKLEPINEYGEQKLIVEEALNQLYSECKTRLVIARVFSILGSNMKPGTLGHAIENIAPKNPLKCADDIRDFLTPEKTAHILYTLATSNLNYNIYNVCSGVSQSVKFAAIRLLNSLKRPYDINLLQSGNSLIPVIQGDIGRLIEVIPKIPSM